MKKLSWFSSAVILMIGLNAGYGGTLTGSGPHYTLFEQDNLARLCLGGDYIRQERTISLEGQSGTTDLEANHGMGYVGIDILSWLAVFGAVGGTSAKVQDADGYGNTRVNWAAGLSANLWHLDVTDPEFLAGSLSLRVLGEYSQFKSGDSDTDEIKWQEWFATLLASYEIFVTDSIDLDQIPFSLVLSVGPVFSKLDGTFDVSGQKLDFSEEQSYGIGGGVEVFIANNLSLGGQVQYYDSVTYGANLRYHF